MIFAGMLAMIGYRPISSSHPRTGRMGARPSITRTSSWGWTSARTAPAEIAQRTVSSRSPTAMSRCWVAFCPLSVAGHTGRVNFASYSKLSRGPSSPASAHRRTAPPPVPRPGPAARPQPPDVPGNPVNSTRPADPLHEVARVEGGEFRGLVVGEADVRQAPAAAFVHAVLELADRLPATADRLR